MEPDQRHVDILVKELGLSEARPVSTPGENTVANDRDDEPLTEHDATRDRAVAARANNLAAYRTDFMYATKEICRSTATPTESAWRKSKRFGRHVLGNGRLTTKYAWQGDEESVTSFSDSDWVLILNRDSSRSLKARAALRLPTLAKSSPCTSGNKSVSGCQYRHGL